MIPCYPDRLAAGGAQIEQEAQGYIGSSDTSFDNLWAFERAKADSCSQRAIDNVNSAGRRIQCDQSADTCQGIGMHMDTAPVARDIIEIFERHGEWREAETKRLLNSIGSLTAEERQQIAGKTAHRRDEEMVQYWGFVCIYRAYHKSVR